MFKKIEKEIVEFASTIKEAEGCDKMLNYMNSNHFSSVKLIMFASSTFSIYAKVMLFFLISTAGLLMSSSLGIIPLSSSLLSGILIFLLLLLLIFISKYRNVLSTSINNIKNSYS